MPPGAGIRSWRMLELATHPSHQAREAHTMTEAYDDNEVVGIDLLSVHVVCARQATRPASGPLQYVGEPSRCAYGPRRRSLADADWWSLIPLRFIHGFADA
jgi:hypothetical protein